MRPVELSTKPLIKELIGAMMRVIRGFYISVSGGTKNFGIDSNAALKAPAFINTRVKYLVFGTSYLIDLSQYSVFMCYAASAKTLLCLMKHQLQSNLAYLVCLAILVAFLRFMS